MFRRKSALANTVTQDDAITQLIGLLKAKMAELEKFFKPQEPGNPMRELRDSLSEKELLQLKNLLKDKSALDKAFNAVLEKGVSELEVHGMQTNSETGERVNIFSKYPARNVNELGENTTDNSKFSPHENYGDVLKKAYSTTYMDDGSGIKGLARSQSDLFMAESYQDKTKQKTKEGNVFPNVADKFLSNLIGVRAQQVEIFITADQSADCLENALSLTTKPSDKKDLLKRTGMYIGNSFISYNMVIENLQNINAYNELMSADVLLSTIKSKGKNSFNEVLFQNIIDQLTLLHKTTSLSDSDRLGHLAILKKNIAQLPEKTLSDPQIKECIDRLKLQVDYALLKTSSALDKAARLSVEAPKIGGVRPGA